MFWLLLQTKPLFLPLAASKQFSKNKMESHVLKNLMSSSVSAHQALGSWRSVYVPKEGGKKAKMNQMQILTLWTV